MDKYTGDPDDDFSSDDDEREREREREREQPLKSLVHGLRGPDTVS